MATVFYILGSLAALTVIVAVIVVSIRALLVMSRLDDTRRDLATFLAESSLTLQHTNRFLARAQESVDRVRHTAERLEKVLALLQPATAVGGILAGARRVLTGRRPHEETVPPGETTGGES